MLTLKARLITALTIVFIGAVPLSQAHEYKKDYIQIAHPWARPTPIKTVPAAVYLDITNTGEKTDRLLWVKIAPTIAKNVEIHENAMKDGMMSMRKIDGPIAIAAGKSLSFVPGGKHIMLRGLSQRLAQGHKFPMTLGFEKAGEIEVQVHVESPDELDKPSSKKITPKVEHADH